MGEKAKQRVVQYFSKEAFDENIISLFINSNSFNV